MASGNIPDELAGFQTYIPQAVEGAITRTPVVFTHDWDGFYVGDFPVILIRPFQPQTAMLDIGQPGRRGTDVSRPTIYKCTMFDEVDLRQSKNPGGLGLLAAAEMDLEALWTVIDNYFDVVANWTLGGAFERVGFATRGRFSDPFQAAPDGATRVAMMAFLYCVGRPHLGTKT